MTCTVCGSGHLVRRLRIPRAPVFCNQLCSSKEEALAVAMASISLVSCGDCGHLFNADFDESLVEYSPEYENSLHFSGRFESFADDLVEQLDARLGLLGKTIVEIGCGRGDFLKKLCSDPTTRGYGFDKSYPGVARDDCPRDNVSIRAEHFTEAYAHLEPDLVCCRHVLEHIEAPVGFLRSVRRIAGSTKATSIYFEVPNAVYTLRDGGIWDILYEHCGYFTPSSLAKAFELGGYSVDRLEATFGGQFLSLFGATSGNGAIPTIERESYGALFDAFASAYEQRVKCETDFMAGEYAAGRKVVVWGAGTKGTMFLNTIVGDRQLVEGIVDINPRKWGKFVPGSGHPILAPEALDETPPDTVIVMNPAYADEIRELLAARGLRPTLHMA